MLHDSIIALFAVGFVFVYAAVHLSSAFLGACTMVCIFLSFPLAFMTYTLVFGFQKMMILNFLALFIIMGIGADDVFVFTDAWIKEGVVEPEMAQRSRVGERLARTYRKAGMAMVYTSTTTSLSFFSNAVSSVPALRAFGVFMGSIVVWLFFTVTLVYPAMLILWQHSACWSAARHRFCKGRAAVPEPVAGPKQAAELSEPEPGAAKPQRKPSFIEQASGAFEGAVRRLSSSSDGSDAAAAEAADRILQRHQTKGQNYRTMQRIREGRMTAADHAREAAEQEKSLAPGSGFSVVDRVFHNTIARFVHRCRVPLALFFTALVCASLGLSFVKFQAADETPKFFAKEHNLGMVDDIRKEYFDAAQVRGTPTAL